MEIVKTIGAITKFCSTSNVHVSLETVSMKWIGKSFKGQVKAILHTGTPLFNTLPLCPSKEFLLDVNGEVITTLDSIKTNLFRFGGEKKPEPKLLSSRIHVADSANFLTDELLLLIEFYKEENHPKITNRSDELYYLRELTEEWLLTERSEHSFKVSKERYDAAN
ncbi:hypothetical protein [Vibrio phage vB_VmeM-Yong XC32]|nr:hypothetical protein [Vibrio phage vB_VmeM-Yong XC31]QAX96399.1 hypothetical protein [Vibrio phage vB_VmeM-Yong XC32]QAX96716.1 hypothetical protein [Vibrio phage vB_VmeM-Yong MS31]QAX97035.1 hypothetical protein [Vibrio phage vB_VmeM-Yong MS32]